MENSPIIRFRINREIAEKAHRMAAERGLELPDVMRLMLIKAVQTGDFSIGQERIAHQQPGVERPSDVYAPSFWEPARSAHDARFARELLKQVVAGHTAWLDQNLTLESPDLRELERVRDERNQACALQEACDEDNAELVAAVIKRFGSFLEAPAASEKVPPTGAAP